MAKEDTHPWRCPEADGFPNPSSGDLCWPFRRWRTSKLWRLLRGFLGYPPEGAFDNEAFSCPGGHPIDKAEATSPLEDRIWNPSTGSALR